MTLREKLFIITIALIIIGLLIPFIIGAKNLSYTLFYKSNTAETIQQLVKPECLKEPQQ